MSAVNDAPNKIQMARASALATEIRALVGKLKRRLREQAAVGGLGTLTDIRPARLEREGPATTSSLARLEGMRPQSMGTVIAPLQAAGLVAGTPDPADGRQTLFSLTDSCRKWVEDGRFGPPGLADPATSRRGLSPEEHDRLAAAVELLKRLVVD